MEIFGGKIMAGKKIIVKLWVVVLAISLFYVRADEASIPRGEDHIFKVGKASWYSEQDPGINERTANNEYFKDSELTCAIWGVPFNQQIRVTNLANGKSIIVRVNDRGPHQRFVRQGRVIDLTKGAFAHLSELKNGLIDVSLEFL